ncbi:MAG: TIGR01777 family protein [Desulfobulbaceae bacterium]|nr:MAG: TIGR01777 family protein [Desulfobulbaceae bacterium]
MNILITGASGLIGSAILQDLVNTGHRVFSLQRNKSANPDQFWNFTRLCELGGENPTFDVVIHLAGENIATGRWTKNKKQRILQSRTQGTEQLAHYCAQLSTPPKLFISASAIGYYGDRGDDVVDEQSKSGHNFVAEVCRAWEAALAPLEKTVTRVVMVRIGMVLSPDGGTLKTMLPSFKLGIAGVVGNGKQYVSWIDIRDIVGSFSHIIQHDSISGPVNLVSPNPVTNHTFTKALGDVVNKPTVMKMPAFVAKTVFGQMGEELVLSSCRVVPKKLKDEGYQFLVPELQDSLHYCVSNMP